MTPTKSIFWPYLSPILETQKTKSGIEYIKMSDANGMDRLLADSRSENTYPAIFVLRPKYAGAMVDNAMILARFEVTLYCFQRSKIDDYDQEDEAMDFTEQVLSEVLKDLVHDMRVCKNYLDFDSVRMEPVMYNTGVDAGYGYELKIKLALPANHIFC